MVVNDLDKSLEFCIQKICTNSGSKGGTHSFSSTQKLTRFVCVFVLGLHQRLYIPPTPETSGQQTESIPCLDQLPLVTQSLP